MGSGQKEKGEVMDLTIIADVLGKSAAVGTAAIFIWLYIDERRASRKQTADLLAFMLKNTEVSVSITNAMTSLKEAIKDGRE